MAIYDGVVTLADDDIPVIVELDRETLRLSASGQEIGEWPAGECSITHVGDTTYTITAEDETIEFVPNQPSLFAAAVNGGSHTPAEPAPSQEGRQPWTGPELELEPETEADSERQAEADQDSPTQREEGPKPDNDVREAPPAKPLTMGMFYALCLVTAGLAIWSLVSIIF